jgi:hypothetical protein
MLQENVFSRPTQDCLKRSLADQKENIKKNTLAYSFKANLTRKWFFQDWDKNVEEKAKTVVNKK